MMTRTDRNGFAYWTSATSADCTLQDTQCFHNHTPTFDSALVSRMAGIGQCVAFFILEKIHKVKMPCSKKLHLACQGQENYAPVQEWPEISVCVLLGKLALI